MIAEKVKNIVFVVCIISILLFGGIIDTRYTMTGTVIDVKGNNVIVEDTTHNMWEFCDDNFEIGQKVKIRFYNNGTDDRFDDVIIRVK